MLPTGKKPKEEWSVAFCLIFERKLLHTSLSSFLCKGIFHKVYGKLDTPGKYWSCIGMGNLGPCWGWNCTDQLLLLQKGSTVKSDWGKKSNLIEVLGQISRGYCFQSSDISIRLDLYLPRGGVTAKTFNCIHAYHLSAANYGFKKSSADCRWCMSWQVTTLRSNSP